MKPQDLSPKEIVAELDRHVVGQEGEARGRDRAPEPLAAPEGRPELKEEILPKNIVMIGPTGVGKTEIARRLARLAGAPFVKVEASKFTEVGYVGRDVDAMVRDLVEASVKLVKEEEVEKLRERAREAAEEKVLDALGYGGGFGLGFRAPCRGCAGRTRRRRRSRPAGASRPARSSARGRSTTISSRSSSPRSRRPCRSWPRHGGHGAGAPGHDEPARQQPHRLDARGRREAQAQAQGEGGWSSSRRRRRRGSSTWIGWSARRSTAHRTRGSSSSTRSTRSPAATPGTARTCRAAACSATCSRSSRARTSTRSTGW